ncbi:MAG: cell envelope integrity protein TolA, partial [Methylovulum sp.]|nr:cell envelope integrity protein TolA [Methylovulum sp.]
EKAKSEAATKANAEATEKAKAEAAAKAKAEAAEKAKAEAAAKAKAEAAEKAKAEAAAKAKAEAAEKTKAEAAAKAKAQESELAEAIAAIKRKVNGSWIRPVSDIQGLKCRLKVRLATDGTVIDVDLVTSSGDTMFDNSAINAVNKASPLDVPKDKELFAKKFRPLIFDFKPS